MAGSVPPLHHLDRLDQELDLMSSLDIEETDAELMDYIDSSDIGDSDSSRVQQPYHYGR